MFDYGRVIFVGLVYGLQWVEFRIDFTGRPAPWVVASATTTRGGSTSGFVVGDRLFEELGSAVCSQELVMSAFGLAWLGC